MGVMFAVSQSSGKLPESNAMQEGEKPMIVPRQP